MGLVEAEGPLAGEAADGTGSAESARSVGSAYLVGPRLAVTCGHVVQHVTEVTEGRTGMRAGCSVRVTFGDRTTPASVVGLDPAANIAVVELESAPTGVPILALAEPTTGGCAFAAVSEDGSPIPAGAIVREALTNRFGDPRMTVRAPELARLLIAPGQRHSGTPVLADGCVVGHAVGAVTDPNDIERVFAGLVEAVPGGAVLELLTLAGLDVSPDTDAPAPGGGTGMPGSLLVPREGERGRGAEPAESLRQRLAAPEIGRKEFHAFLSYRAVESRGQSDGDWTAGLMDRLGALGYVTFAAPHVLFGPGGFGPRYLKALGRSRVALLIFSERWLEGVPYKDHLKPVLKRLKKSSDGFRVLIVRLDAAELPTELAEFPTIDASGSGSRVGNKGLPTWAVVREIAAALTGRKESSSDDSGPGAARLAAAPMPKGLGERVAGESAVDAHAEVGSAADRILQEMASVRKEPRKIRALAMRWLDAGMPGSDVPVEAARLLIGRQSYDAALEVLDRAEREARDRNDASPNSREMGRILRMRGAALGEADRFDEAIEVLERLERDGMLDQWSGGILASNYKQKWVRLGKRHRALLQRAYDIYLDAYARTLHYYPGINAATLAMHLGQEARGKEIAESIRAQLEGNDDLYFWDEASLGEAFLLLGEYEKAVEAYSSAAVQAMGTPQYMVSMRRQIPLILGDPGSDTESERTREVLRSLFDIGRVAAFVGPDSSPNGQAAAGGSLRERLVRRRIREALDHHDVTVGFSGLSAGSDIIFVECVLERFGEAHVTLPYTRAAFRETVPAGDWRDRFDGVLDRKGVHVTVLRDEEPADRDAARRECDAAILDQALAHARAREEKPVFLALGVESSADPDAALAVQAARDEGIDVEPIDLVGEAGAPEAAVGTPGTPATAEVLTAPGTESVASPETSVPATAAGGEQRGGERGVNLGTTGSTAPSQRERGDYRKRHLVVVGIDGYAHWRPLQNARSDAEGLRDTLVKHYGFELSGELYDRDATKSGIEDVFVSGLGEGKGKSGAVEPEDLVVFFFAGHGHTERRPNDEEEGFLVPVEAPREGKAKMLRITDIRNWTNDLAARHVLFIFDSCFSGAATTGGGGGGKPGFARRVITAGAPDQVVADGGTDWPNHSVFTGRLLYGLGPAETRLPKPLVFASELASYLVRYVPEDAKAVGARSPQTPSDGLLPGHGGDTIVLKRLEPAADAEDAEDA